MAETDCVVYDKVKAALLLRFNLTEEGVRERFRVEAPKDGKTVTQYVARLKNNFDRWIELAGVTRSFEALKELLLEEQLFAQIEEKLATFLSERTEEDIKYILN